MLRDSKLHFDRPSPVTRLITVGVVLLCGLLVAGLRGPAGRQQALAEDSVKLPQEKPAASATASAAPAVADRSIDTTYMIEKASWMLVMRPAAVFSRPELAPLAKLLEASGNVVPAGTHLADFRQITAIAPEAGIPSGPREILVLQWVKPIAEESMRACTPNLKDTGKEYKGKKIYVNTGGRALLICDAHTVIEAGSEQAVGVYLAGKLGVLPKWLPAKAWESFRDDDIVTAADTAMMRREMKPLVQHYPPIAQAAFLPISSLLDDAAWLGAGARLDDRLTVHAWAAAKNDDSAVKLRRTVEALKTLAESLVKNFRAPGEAGRRPQRNMAFALLDEAGRLLDNMKIQQEGNDVRLQASVEFDKARLKALATTVVASVQPPDTGSKAGMMALVEDFFKYNFRDVTSRETIEWGEVTKTDDGNFSIRYKYRARIWDKETKIINQVFTFDKQGRFVSVKDVMAAPGTKEGMMQRVEDFFKHNFRDVTSRETIEWGEVAKTDDGNFSIRYKYRARIWDKETKIMNQVFTFDKRGEFVSVKDVTAAPGTKTVPDAAKPPGAAPLKPGARSATLKDIETLARAAEAAPKAGSVPIEAEIMPGAEKQTVKCVVEWEKSAVSDTQMPPLTVAQLRAEFEKVAAASAALKSWEARCRVTSRYESGGTSTSSTLLLSDGKQWLDESRRGNWADGKIERRSLCDGELVRHIPPHDDIKVLIIQNLSEFAAKEHAPGNIPEMPPAGFPPFLLVYSEHYSPPHSFPDIGKILADPATKVLPWRTRVGGHFCYVVERTRTTQTPMFRSREETEAWLKQNPNGSVIVNRDAAAKDMRIDEYTDRAALDPQSRFLAVHWARGHTILTPAFRVKSTGRDVPRRELIQFPVEEAVCSDFQKFGDFGYVAGRVELVQFSTDLEGHQKTVASQEVVLEDFQANRHYPPDLFRFDPPKGYHVCDSIRGIQYSVGDSQEKVAALLAAAQAKKAFYEALKKKPAPSLEGAVWLNTKPIRLEDALGKHIQLHFWSIGCGPCLYELPRLEEEWGHSPPGRIRGDRDNYVFISIHPYVDGDDLQQLKDLLRKKQITFPVMVDSRAPDGKAWGKTSAYYHVYSEPSDVWIDAKGHVASLSSERGWVGEGDRWMGTADDRRPKNRTEKSP